VQKNTYKNPPGFEERFKKGMQSGWLRGCLLARSLLLQ
jgi:hypothetical protein